LVPENGGFTPNQWQFLQKMMINQWIWGVNSPESSFTHGVESSLQKMRQIANEVKKNTRFGSRKSRQHQKAAKQTMIRSGGKTFYISTQMYTVVNVLNQTMRQPPVTYHKWLVKIIPNGRPPSTSLALRTAPCATKAPAWHDKQMAAVETHWAGAQKKTLDIWTLQF
jgi:hypothetical protein